MTAKSFQDLHYGEDIDYGRGSPHLSHRDLYLELVSVVHRVLLAIDNAGLPHTVLEVGAGHGGYTESVLAAGYEVTAVDMASASVQHLQSKYSMTQQFTAIFDESGDLRAVEGQFSLV